MFKKPKGKRIVKTSFRSKINVDDSDNKHHTVGHTLPGGSGVKGRSTGDGSSDDETDTTSTLVAQAMANRRPNLKRTIDGLSTAEPSQAAEQTSGLLHQYKVRNEGVEGALSAQDMATREAEYHPFEDLKRTSSIDTESNGDDERNQQAGIYRGRKEKRNKFLAGPLKAPTFVRTTCRFDYQPDICKDYKDTGFCGFGDTCIYLHDRGDTLTGWQLEKHWEEKKKAEQIAKEQEINRFVNGGTVPLEESVSSGLGEADGIPFACHICRGPFQNPIVTSCGHFFCQECILQLFKNDPCCPVCRKDTHGAFNYPTKLLSKKRRTVGNGTSWQDYADALKSDNNGE